MPSDNVELSPGQMTRLGRADALTRDQLTRARAIVSSSFNGVSPEYTMELTGQVLVALATNYLAEVNRTA